MRRGCMDLILQAESRAKQKYKWVVCTRADMYWMGPHFSPVGLGLEPRWPDGKLRAWVPWGQENSGKMYAGLNSRHVLLPRELAGPVMDMWGAVQSGVLPLAVHASGEPWTGGELFWSLHLRLCGARVAFFNPMAIVMCCASTAQCEREGMQTNMSDQANKDALVVRNEMFAKYGLCAKYSSEYTEATLGTGNHRELVRYERLGAAWSLTPRGDLAYVCCHHEGVNQSEWGVGSGRVVCPCIM